ncbi:MAG: DtxR family transcriptional regulator [Actinomycetota bacterium]
MPARTSPAAQDYLKALYQLAAEGAEAADGITTTAVAHRMDVSAASATNMLKRLEGMGLVDYIPYQGAGLTEAGRKIALEVIRHHRLLETYLAEALGVPWDAVHEEAEVLEHVLSEDLEDRMAALLGDPSTDPHGHPIPAKDGSMPSSSARRLWEVADGQWAEVERVSDSSAESLRYLAGIGVRPGVTVEVVRRGPLSGPLFVRVGGDAEQALSKELAEDVWVA